MRVVALGDTHCGHRAGLTTPDWRWPTSSGTDRHKAWGRVQKECWEAYMRMRDVIGPADVLIANGDLIDGRGERSGSTELITTDRIEQCEMAIRALKVWDAKRIIVTRGTDYHVGVCEQFEDIIAANLKADIRNHAFIQVCDLIFDVKHTIGGSSIPHGRATPLARDRLQNMMWAEHAEQPKGDILLRSHVHYFLSVGGRSWEGFILPALQAAGTRWGGKVCSGTVDWGLMVFDVDGRDYRWEKHIASLKANRSSVIVVEEL